MSDWKKYKLSEIVDLIGGGTPKTTVSDYWGGAIPWLSVVDFGGDARRVYQTEKTITELGLKESSTKILKQGQLIISARGTVGEIAQLGRDMAFNQSCYGVTGKEGIVENDFLYYLLKTSVQDLKRNTHGAVFDTITRQTFDSIDVSVPAIPIQRAIAKVLGDLDDKIEVNAKMNQALEDMARALFKSWFVDFDPVRAKAASKPTGLPKEISALFPSRLVDSELGEIPEDWSVGTVDDDIILTMGQSPAGTTYNESGEGMPMYQGRTDFGFRFPTRRIFTTAPTRIANPGDTLISVRAPVGDVNMASEKCCVGRGVAAAMHKSGSKSYTYYFMSSIHEQFQVFEGEGTVFGSINKDDFHNIEKVVPRNGVVEAFQHLVGPIDDKISINDEEIKTLTALRDSLLPKLMSGELRM